MEKSEKAKKLRELRKYGKKVSADFSDKSRLGQCATFGADIYVCLCTRFKLKFFRRDRKRRRP